MNRRQFLKTLVTVVVAGPILSEIEIGPVTPNYWSANFKDLDVICTEITPWEYLNYMYLRGTQYLFNDGTTGEWMGIRREEIDCIPVKLGHISSDGSSKD